jgi:hypothetical protein
MADHGSSFVVANTGLDQVLELDTEGRVRREWSVLPEEDPWDRFDREVDYRKVLTTKPHRSHPNFVVAHDEQLWVARFAQRDLLCLDDPRRRIDVGVQRVHDGSLLGDRVYMTTVDGHIAIGDLRAGQLIRTHDLNAMTPAQKDLGWCRGLHVLAADRVVVGFSRLRPSRARENLQWVKFKMGMRDNEGRLPTRIACYDLTAGRLEWEIDLEPHGLNAVFSIIPADPGTHTDRTAPASPEERR